MTKIKIEENDTSGDRITKFSKYSFTPHYNRLELHYEKHSREISILFVLCCLLGKNNSGGERAIEYSNKLINFSLVEPPNFISPYGHKILER